MTLALALLGCGGPALECDPLDADGDGVRGAPCEVGTFDCNDADPLVFPGAPEACDGVDNDCSGAADEPFDVDLDGSAVCAGDCDDDDPRNAPTLVEVCDGADNDCDLTADEGFDGDGDGQTVCRGDCDDADPDVFFGAIEGCDGVENDCDASTSERGDLDDDGVTACDGDCDDNDPLAIPGGIEVCDDVDNDCNGEIDELEECWGCTDVVGARFCPVYVDWDTARATCEEWGFGLVILDDADRNTEVSDAAAEWLGVSAWIGLSDVESEGEFLWIDGELPKFTSWAPGEPNDAGGEDCAATNFADVSLWNDFQCGTPLPFVCQLP